jgi:hypothetical protein
MRRLRTRAALLMVGLAGCSAGLLEAVTNPPTGLPVTLTTTFTPGIVPTSGSIAGAADSVVAIVSSPATCGRTLSADAGETVAGLLITITLSMSGVQNCAPLNGMTSYHAVVHGVPAGSHNVSAHLRLVTNGAVSDTTVAQATITLP